MANGIDFSRSSCPCGGSYERRSIDVTMKIGDETERLTDVLQGACSSCGSRVYHAETLERVECMMKKSGAPDGAVNRGY